MSYVGLGATTTSEVTQSTDAAAEAVALSMDPTKGTKYKTALAAAKWSGQQLDSAISAFNNTQAGKIVGATDELGSAVLQMVENAKQGKYKADASGVVNIALDTTPFLNAFSKFSTAVGGRAGEVMNEISAWVGIGAGCAAGIAAANVWGAVGCGFAVVGKLFADLFGGRTMPKVDPLNVPRTVFSPRGKAMSIIAADALRLAQVLRRYYGVNSYEELYNKLRLAQYTWLTRTYPAAPEITADGKIAAPPDAPVPGHNLRTILQLLNPVTDEQGIVDALRFLAAVRSRDNLERDEAQNAIKGRPLFTRYQDDHDISEAAVAHGAFIGVSGVNTYGRGKVRTFINSHQANNWYIDSPGTLSETQLEYVANFTPFVQLDELINFFGAVTIRELKDNAVRGSLIEDYGFGNDLPLKQLYVRNVDRSGQPGDPRYEADAQCRTNLRRFPNDCGETFKYIQQTPFPARTIRDMAAVRLCAAFSYIHMQFEWSRKKLRTTDIIANVPTVNPSDPTALMSMPVDPRQILPTANGYKLRLPPPPNAVLPAVPINLRNESHPTQTEPLRPYPKNLHPFARAIQSPEVLAKAIDEHERVVQEAIAKLRAETFNPQLATSIREHMRTVLQGRAATPGTALYNPLQAISLRVAPKQSFTGPLLIGAAALLAFKFLK